MRKTGSYYEFIGITANKIYFCFQMPQASTLSFLRWNEGSKTKILIFQLITLVKWLLPPLYTNEFEACAKQTWMPTCITPRGQVLSTACLQTVSRSVTLIKAQWLKHRNTFGLGSSLSFDQTLKFPRRFKSSHTDGIKSSCRILSLFWLHSVPRSDCIIVWTPKFGTHVDILINVILIFSTQFTTH